MSKSFTAWKSEPAVAVPLLTCTATLLSVEKTGDRAALTVIVVGPASSATRSGSTESDSPS